MKLLLATRNAHKTREFAAILGSKFEVEDLNVVPRAPEIDENGQTFAENAQIKALTVSKVFPDVWVIADDSGLEVAALAGAPGIHSARYAGPHARDEENVQKLLREPRLAEQGDRSARFVCAIAVARNDILLGEVSGEIRGRITEIPSGKKGFGYDPIFVPDGSGNQQTFAEMLDSEKNLMSHRAVAIAHLRDFLSRAVSLR